MGENNIKFIVGPHGSGKTTYIYDEIIKYIKDEKGNINLNKKAFIVVPEQDTKEKQKSFMEYKSNTEKGMINCDVVSFDRICHMVFQKLMIDENELNIIQDDTKALLCQIAVERKANELPFYKKKIRKIGFSEKIASSISEFSTYKIDNEKIDRILKDENVNQNIKNELKELSIINEEFNNLLKSTKLNIVEDKLKIIKDNIDNVNIFDNAIVFFDGFTGFSPTQKDIFDKISKKANRVYISIDYRLYEFNNYINGKYEKLNNIEKFENNIFHISDLFIESICDKEQLKNNIIVLSEGLQYKYNINNTTNNKSTRNDLLYLEENIFKNEIDNNNDIEPNHIHLNHSKNIKEEIEFVINKIIELTRINDNNITYNDIKIIVPNIENYKDEIISKFNKYNIPLFIDDSQTIFSSPYVKAIRGFIDCIDKDFSYESIMSFVNSGLFSIIYSEDDDSFNFNDSIYYFDNALRMFGINSFNQLVNKKTFLNKLFFYMSNNEIINKGSQKQYLDDKTYIELLDYIDKKETQIKEIGLNNKNNIDNPIFNNKSEISKHSSQIYKIYNDIVYPIVCLYEDIIKTNKDKKYTFTEFVNIIERFIENTNLDEKVDSFIKKLEIEKYQFLNKKDLIILDKSKEKIKNILSLLKRIDIENITTKDNDEKDNKYTLTELSQILDLSIDIFKVKSIPFSMEQVVVGDLMRSRFDNPKVLFFIGMNDSALPQKRNDDSIINDKIRVVFNNNNIPISQSLLETTYNSRFYTYLALTNETDDLYLSYTDTNVENEVDYKSKYLTEVEDLFKKEVIDKNNNKKLINVLDELSKTNNKQLPIYDIKQMRDFISIHNSDNNMVIKNIDKFIERLENLNTYEKNSLYNAIISKYYYDILLKIDNNKNNIELDKKSYSNIDLRHLKIKKDNMSRLLGNNKEYSATSLENYARCPYKYFIEKIIGLKQRENNNTDQRDIGNIFHSVLETFFNNENHYINVIDEKGKDKRNNIDIYSEKLKTEIYDISEKIIIKEFDTHNKKNDTNAQKFIIDYIKEVIYQSIIYILSQIKFESPLVKVYHELSFDDFNIDKKNKLKGRIDQVELLKSFDDKSKYVDSSLSLNDDTLYIKITDYKSSEKKIEQKKIESGETIQFIIYLDYIKNNIQNILKSNKNNKKNNIDIQKYKKIVPLGTFYKPIIDYIDVIKKEDIDKYKKELLKEQGSVDLKEEEIYKNYALFLRKNKMKMTGIINISDDIYKILDNNAKATKRDNGNLDKKNTSFESFSPDSGYNLQYTDGIEDIINKVKQIVADEITNIENGNIKISKNSTACDYCPFNGSCKKEKAISKEDNENE